MNKLFFLLVLMSANFSSVVAQNFSKDYWHRGVAYLFSQDSVGGLIQYDLERNSIIVRTADNKLQTYNASQVEQFWIEDALQKKIRYFYALPQVSQKNYRALHFFELLTEGKITLLCREVFVVRQVGYYSPYMWGGWVNGGTYTVQEDDYFLLNQDGNVEDLEESEEAIMALFGSDREEIIAFRELTNNKLRNRADLLELIKYYNNKYQ